MQLDRHYEKNQNLKKVDGEKRSPNKLLSFKLKTAQPKQKKRKGFRLLTAIRQRLPQ